MGNSAYGQSPSLGVDLRVQCEVNELLKGAVLMDVSTLVEPDRVHRSVYTDQEVFDREIENIFETVWVYCGHESQIPNVGDYYSVQIGRQPMIMVRGREGAIHVLYNRCPHRGVQVCGALKGNAGTSLACSYHG